jgi:hypothetical protein
MTSLRAMVDADPGATQPVEIFLSLVGADIVKAVGLSVVDSFHFEPIVQAFPRTGFNGMNNGALGDTRADEGNRLALGVENSRDQITTPLANNNRDFPFPLLVAGISAVAAIFLAVGWLYIASKVSSIHFSL